MDWLWYIIIGLVSGVFAGMGMGGGTFLIPLLTLFMKTPQIDASGINLVVFVPMAIIVSIIYGKSKLLNIKEGITIAIPAVIVSVAGSLLAIKIGGKVITIVFGIFISVVGVASIIKAIVVFFKEKKENKIKEQKSKSPENLRE